MAMPRRINPRRLLARGEARAEENGEAEGETHQAKGAGEDAEGVRIRWYRTLDGDSRDG